MQVTIALKRGPLHGCVAGALPRYFYEPSQVDAVFRRVMFLQIMFHLVMFPAAGARWRTSKQG
jgi:hypothetical protein